MLDAALRTWAPQRGGRGPQRRKRSQSPPSHQRWAPETRQDVRDARRQTSTKAAPGEGHCPGPDQHAIHAVAARVLDDVLVNRTAKNSELRRLVTCVGCSEASRAKGGERVRYRVEQYRASYEQSA
eukprot:gene5122-564_t